MLLKQDSLPRLSANFNLAGLVLYLLSGANVLAAENPPPPSSSKFDTKDAKELWWSLKPLTKPAVPHPANVKFKTWTRTAIDQSILAKLSEKGLQPSTTADKRTLLRRVYFDLIGLP